MKYTHLDYNDRNFLSTLSFCNNLLLSKNKSNFCLSLPLIAINNDKNTKIRNNSLTLLSLANTTLNSKRFSASLSDETFEKIEKNNKLNEKRIHSYAELININESLVNKNNLASKYFIQNEKTDKLNHSVDHFDNKRSGINQKNVANEIRGKNNGNKILNNRNLTTNKSVDNFDKTRSRKNQNVDKNNDRNDLNVRRNNKSNDKIVNKKIKK